jgi:hypothetical protein
MVGWSDAGWKARPFASDRRVDPLIRQKTQTRYRNCQDALAPAASRLEPIARRRHGLAYFAHAITRMTFISICWLSSHHCDHPASIVHCCCLRLPVPRKKHCKSLHFEPINPSEARSHQLSIQVRPSVCCRACPDGWSALMMWKRRDVENRHERHRKRHDVETTYLATRHLT